MKKPFIHHGLFLSLITTTILTSCDFTLPSSTSQSSSPSSQWTSSELAALFEPVLAPQVPYLTADYALPTLPEAYAGYQVTWTSPTLTIEGNTVKYPHPYDDVQTSLIATITQGQEVVTLTYPLLIKSQLHVPAVALKPVLRIQLDGGRREQDISRNTLLTATASVQADVNGTYQSLNLRSPLTIRTRGNSTQFMPKRPYRIRFNENTSLFGMKSAKNYELLANYLDRSMVRNSLITYMSKFYQDTMYTLDYRFVELYISGTYYGNYLLMERVEFSKNRLDINTDLTQDDAGFMVELDFQVDVQNVPDENLAWFRMNGIPYMIKEPNPLDTASGYRTRHTTYIKNYFAAVRNGLVARQGYETLIDVENWVDYFLLQEIAKNVDVGWGSVFMTKETGGKLKHQSLWDFDLAFGNADYMPYEPEGHWGWATYNKNDFFTLMMRIPAIKTRFKQKLAEFQTTYLPKVIQWLNQNQQALTLLSAPNFQTWPMDRCDGWCPIPQDMRNFTTINQQFTYLRNFLTLRVDWMSYNI